MRAVSVRAYLLLAGTLAVSTKLTTSHKSLSFPFPPPPRPPGINIPETTQKTTNFHKKSKNQKLHNSTALNANLTLTANLTSIAANLTATNLTSIFNDPFNALNSSVYTNSSLGLGTNPSSCPNSCGGHGVCSKLGTCACFDGYTGEDCSVAVAECSFSGGGPKCGEHGQCVKGGLCECRDGYAGFRCRYPPCPSRCSDNGLCLHDAASGQPRCLCMHGYTGSDCGELPCASTCFMHGQCVLGHEGSFRCECKKGWTGPDCNIRTCEANCGSHGQCVRVVKLRNASVVISAIEARRDMVRLGESKINPLHDTYQLYPDLNIPNIGASYQCHCDTGYRGRMCDKKICPFNCTGRGTCEESGICRCASGFFGPFCQHSISTCPNMCNIHKNQGNCTRNGCNCLPGFGGKDCSLACTQECIDQGYECVAGQCVCPDGLTGPSCKQRKCRNDCQNDGVCVDGQCLCRAPYAGSYCQMKVCADSCNKHGSCVDGKCQCDQGFAGEVCELHLCPKDCTNAQQGSCNTTSGECICNPPYFGADCGHYKCEKECSFHGECVDGECECDPGWHGSDCSTYSSQASHHRGKRTAVSGSSGSGSALERVPAPAPVPKPPRTSAHTHHNSSGSSSHYQVSICSAHNDCLGRLGRGRCEEGGCVCKPEFWGARCEHRTCKGKDLSISLGPNLNTFCMDRGVCTQKKGKEKATTPPDMYGSQCACYQGFFGKNCEFHSQCPNQCSGHGICLESGSCACDAPFHGDDCSQSDAATATATATQTDASHNLAGARAHHSKNRNTTASLAPEDNLGDTNDTEIEDPSVSEGDNTCAYGCSHHGVCHSGVCYCELDWYGEMCEKIRCPSDCNHHGVCTNVMDNSTQELTWNCECNPGFDGLECENQLSACPHNCSGHGQCSAVQGGGMFCHCDQGFSGPGCQDKVCDKTCSEHGVCLNEECYCDLGYLGEDCSVEICPSQCSSHGVCNPVEGCKCFPGWTGGDCSDKSYNGSDYCPDQCNNHGSCQREDNGAYRCLCDDGWSGDACAQADCGGPDACGAHGTCSTPGNCACDPGWQGDKCEVEICPNQCSRRGFCNMKKKKCECLPGYIGEDCSRAGGCDTGGAFGGRNCSAHGICIGSQCRCADGYFGDFCERRWCPDNCGKSQGRGVCSSGWCNCTDGFFGDACQHADRAMCLVNCEKRCSPYRVRSGGGLVASMNGSEPHYDRSSHTIVYQTKRNCFNSCALECDAAALILGDGTDAADADSSDDDGSSEEL